MWKYQNEKNVPQVYSLIDGQHNGQRVRQMRRRMQHTRPLVQRLFHHSILFQIQLHDRLLQITNPAMNEFRASARGAAGEIVTFYKCGLEATCGGIEGTTGPRCTTPYDDNVEALRLEGFELFIAGGKVAFDALGGVLLGSNCCPLKKNKKITNGVAHSRKLKILLDILLKTFWLINRIYIFPETSGLGVAQRSLLFIYYLQNSF